MASYGLLAGNCGSCSCSIAVGCIGVEGEAGSGNGVSATVAASVVGRGSMF